MGQGRPQPRVSGEIDDRTAGTELRVRRSPDDQRQTRLPTGGGAHRTRLEGDIERTTLEPPIVLQPAAVGERQQLRVRSRVRELDPPVAGASEDLPGPGEHGAHRDLAPRGRSLRLAQSLGHESAIGVVENPVRQHLASITKGARSEGPPRTVGELRSGYLISIRSPTPSGAQERVMMAVE